MRTGPGTRATRRGPCPAEEAETGTRSLFFPKHNRGLAPAPALRDLLASVYGGTVQSLSRRELLGAFGHQRLGGRIAEAVTQCLAERGVGLAPPLIETQPDEDVRLWRVDGHFAPDKLAQTLRGEIECLAAMRARLRYRDLLLFCGYGRNGAQARGALRGVLEAGRLSCSPDVGEARAQDWVYVALRDVPARRELAVSASARKPLQVGRADAERYADSWLASRHPAWRSDEQREVTARFIEGRDTFAVLPTGSGKSLSFQLTADCLAPDGLTLVVSPLLALIADQTKVEAAGATFLNSTVAADDRRQRRQYLWEGRYGLLYVTPEQLGSESLLRILTEGARPVVRVAIDEAHCVSEWGHSFRVEYLLLRDALARLGAPPVLLLTATAPPKVRRDVTKQLGLEERINAKADVVHDHYRRSELDPGVASVRGSDGKFRRLGEFIRSRPPGSRGIIYTRFATAGEVDDRVNCREIAEWVEHEDLGPAALYHGQLSPDGKGSAQTAFTGGDARVMVATNAFGLGIDLPRIDWIVHFYMPPSILDYYQEIGRGGRGMDHSEGDCCSCLLLYDPDDRETVEQLVRGNVASADKVAQRFNQLIAGGSGQHGLRGPHEVLYDDARRMLLLPFRPMATQYTVRIGHMLALQDIGVVCREPQNLYRQGNVYAQFRVVRDELTASDRRKLESRQERRRQEVLKRLDEMERFCTEQTGEARWRMLDRAFGH